MKKVARQILEFDPGSKRSNLKLLAVLHRLIQPRLYLEIGVRWGDSLVLSGDRTFALGIDPDPHLKMALPRRTWLSRRTSDEFFRHYGSFARLLPWRPELALIDGMHLAEFVIRDFFNLEQIMASGGTIVLDDTNPPREDWASRENVTGEWTGDVWKALAVFKRYRPDLRITTFDVQPAGLTIIRGLDRRSRILRNSYERILGDLDALDYDRDFENGLKALVRVYTPEALLEVISEE